jgi:AcrR family transcriptional regulator
MRITGEEKEATRGRIVEAAVALFRKQGFETTTTRDIARAAGIATGTLFNYFVTKEAIVASLAEESLGRARAAFVAQELDGDLAEKLFALIAAELRALKPLRRFITPLLETLLSPQIAARQTVAARGASDHSVWEGHVELVEGIIAEQRIEEFSAVSLQAVSLQIYWALYTGVLAFWAADKSPKQEDTLALLDQSTKMFAAWLRDAARQSS